MQPSNLDRTSERVQARDAVLYIPLTLVSGESPLEEAARVKNSAPLKPDAIHKGTPAAKAVEAAARILNDASIAFAMSQALDKISPEADKAIRTWADYNEYGQSYDAAKVGALIHVLLTRPINWPNPRPVSFQTLFLAAQDLDPRTALNKYLAVPAAMPGPPAGTEQLWRFIWKTLDA